MSINASCKASGPLLQVTALDLVRREDFPRLQDLLRGEFQPLSRLLLLLAWTQCQSLDSAHTLLSILHHNQVKFEEDRELWGEGRKYKIPNWLESLGGKKMRI